MTQPVQEPSQGRTDQGQEWRTRQLFRRPAPQAATPTPGAQRPIFGFTAVQSVLTAPAKWPGGMVVVPIYGFAQSGSTITDSSSFAKSYLDDDQTAASFAAAADTALGTVEDWDLVAGVRYQCWVGAKVAAGAATAHIGIESTSIGTNQIALTGYQADNFGLYRLFSDKTFAAGESISLKEYRTSSAGTVSMDQLYFFPTNATGYRVGPGSGMEANLAAITLASRSDLGVSCTSVSDTRFDGTAIKDTQVQDDYKFADPSAWTFLVAMLGYNVATGTQFDDELRIFRHNYVSACYESATDSLHQKGCEITMAASGVPMATAHIFLPSAGFYYLGPSNPYFDPPQLTLWRNSATGSPSVPYQNSSTTVTTDVRAGNFFSLSSYLDDYY